MEQHLLSGSSASTLSTLRDLGLQYMQFHQCRNLWGGIYKKKLKKIGFNFESTKISLNNGKFFSNSFWGVAEPQHPAGCATEVYSSSITLYFDYIQITYSYKLKV